MHMVTERCAGIPGGRAPEFPVTTEEKNLWKKKDNWMVEGLPLLAIKKHSRC